MLTQSPAVAARRRAPPGLLLHPPQPEAALLDSLGAIEGEYDILVLGRDGPDLMCALLRAGASRVTHLRSHERLEADSASMVLIPHISSLDWLATAMPRIRRALIPNGRLAARIDSLPTTQNAVRRMLTQHGFAAIRLNRAPGCHVLSAELPAFGLQRCA